MAELSALRDARTLGEFNMASADTVVYKGKSIRTGDMSDSADIVRAQHVQETLKRLGIPPWAWRVNATLAALGTSAGTPAGAFGLTPGTHGSATPIIVGESASGNSKTNVMRTQVQIPWEYDPGESCVLRVMARVTANCNTSQSLDLSVYLSDEEAGIDGSDLYAGAVVALSTTFDELSFALSPATLTPGAWLDLLLTGLADDTGGSAGSVIQIAETSLLLDIRG